MSKHIFLNDKVANIILNDNKCRKFLVNLVSKALNLDKELVDNNLELVSGRINNNVNSKYSIADSVYENNTSIINIEVNMKETKNTYKKNSRYICQLLLRQTLPGEEDDFKPIYQINLNNFDVFKKNKFIVNVNIKMYKNGKITMYKKRNKICTKNKLFYIFIFSINYVFSSI